MSRRSGKKGSSRRYDGFLSKGKARYDRHDHYYRKAKTEGYAARSVYKLEELDQAVGLLNKGNRIIDLGCAPGSWLQYAAEKVGVKGCAVGIDHVHFLQGDIFKTSIETLVQAAQGEISEAQDGFFDVVLSDMAPNTTGIKQVDQDRSLLLCERALELAMLLLKEDGHFCVKIFEGGGVPKFIQECRSSFENVKIRRPQSTRAGSMETYIVGIKKKGTNPSGMPEKTKL